MIRRVERAHELAAQGLVALCAHARPARPSGWCLAGELIDGAAVVHIQPSRVSEASRQRADVLGRVKRGVLRRPARLGRRAGVRRQPVLLAAMGGRVWIRVWSGGGGVGRGGSWCGVGPIAGGGGLGRAARKGGGAHGRRGPVGDGFVVAGGWGSGGWVGEEGAGRKTDGTGREIGAGTWRRGRREESERKALLRGSASGKRGEKKGGWAFSTAAEQSGVQR